MSEPLLEVEDLEIKYATGEGPVTAVSGASFAVDEEEYFGVVGESGCGKSTLADAIIGGLDANGQVTSGSIRYRGEDIHDMSEAELNKKVRWNEISWIPQSSMNSLDPLKKVSKQAVNLAEIHTDMSKEEALNQFREMFDIVGLPESRVTDYPHQFSGGMQQRAIIALALFLRPSFIIADEPTTALDVIMQDQIFKYLDRVKDQGTSMLMITHDISLVFESCDRMAVMHGGQTTEVGTVEEVFDEPHHPYSILLQGSFPDVRFPDRDLSVIEGHPPQLRGEVDFCTFADRCPMAIEECRTGAPPLEPVEAATTDGDSVGDQSANGGFGTTAPSHRVHKAACIRKEESDQLYPENKQ